MEGGFLCFQAEGSIAVPGQLVLQGADPGEVTLRAGPGRMSLSIVPAEWSQELRTQRGLKMFLCSKHIEFSLRLI